MGGEGGWVNDPRAIWEGREAGSIIHTPYARAIWEGREAGSMIHTPYGRGGRLAQ